VVLLTCVKAFDARGIQTLIRLVLDEERAP